MLLPFFTIGHSNSTIGEFIAMLQESSVELVVDIRTVPKSRSNPQFNKDSLPHALAPAAIDYLHMADLGGLRPKSKQVPTETNSFWTNASFHNYADYALSKQFHAALAILIELGRQRRTTIMCAEAVWWRCHRRIVSDYLLAQGETVFHIMRAGHAEPATLTKGAEVKAPTDIEYPSATGSCCLPE